MAVVRVRQHVNPLSDRYQIPVSPPDWATVFADPSRPLHVDLGCGKGLFLMAMAPLVPEWNFLGLEIRKPLVEQAQRRIQDGPSNLYLMYSNVNVSFRDLIASLPTPCPLRRVSVQFPDPWFKKRHQKRRVLQPAFVATLADLLPPGGEVVVQSDVEPVAIDMVARLSEHPAFVAEASAWLPTSPFPAQTDRERVTLEQGKPVYRARFIRQPE